MTEIIKAKIEIVDGVRWYICAMCGHKWPPRKPSPKECPACKRHLIITEAMQERMKKRNEMMIPEVVDARDVLPEMFTAACAFPDCKEDAVGKYRGAFLCEIHLLRKMKEGGLLKDI